MHAIVIAIVVVVVLVLSWSALFTCTIFRSTPRSQPDLFSFARTKTAQRSRAQSMQKKGKALGRYCLI